MFTIDQLNFLNITRKWTLFIAQHQTNLVAQIFGTIIVLGLTVTIFAFNSSAQSTGICDRTSNVQDAILAELSPDRPCKDVTSAQLATISTIDIGHEGISELQERDFKGLTGLKFLGLDYNDLSSLPKGLFDELTSLTYLSLTGNDLSSLPKDLFDELTNLQILMLADNELSELPQDQFDGLTRLILLRLGANPLGSLHENLFDELTSLKILYLFSTSLTSLPDNLFDHKKDSPLLHVDLLENDIECFPTSITNNEHVQLYHPNKGKACLPALPLVTLELSADPPILPEGGQRTLTATLDKPSSEETTVTVTISPTSTDYTVDTKTLTIPPRQTTSNPITITAVDNDVDESDRIFTITGTATENVTDPEDITFTIEDDDYANGHS